MGLARVARCVSVCVYHTCASVGVYACMCVSYVCMYGWVGVGEGMYAYLVFFRSLVCMHMNTHTRMYVYICMCI